MLNSCNMSSVSKNFFFYWQITNYSFCTLKNGECLISPEFTVDEKKETLWYLSLYPRGRGEENEGYLSIVLNRCKVDDGPEEFPLGFHILICGKKNLVLKSEICEYTFKKGSGNGLPRFLRIEEIGMPKMGYLPEDALNVLVMIHMNGRNIVEGNLELFAGIGVRTRIATKEISFLHVIENFSTLEPNQKRTVNIRSFSNEGLDLTCSLYFVDDSWCNGKIIVEITPSDTNQILSVCKISLLDISGKEIECGAADNRFDASRKEINKLPLSLTKQMILKRESSFLIEDKLLLKSKCIFSIGVESKKILFTHHESPLEAFIKTIWNKNKCDEPRKLEACPNALDDFKAVYDNKLFADVELKTKTKSFPSHKIVLCARSPVFKAMLTNDMKERNTDCIQVDDLENDTVEQLLHFFYSDKIENLEWESAIKLYYAADKYAIEKLKVICSCFLVDNLSISVVSELLLLADTHNDSDLKKEVEDFIFKHEEEVFGSDEWRDFVETNSLLASKTMCRKYIINE